MVDKINKLYLRDCFLTKENEFYYITGTSLKEDGKSLYIYKSKDLKYFEEIEIYKFDSKLEDLSVWAPEIHKYNNEFYIFVTLKYKKKKRGTFILKSASIEGPYDFISDDPITPKEWTCLDASLFVDNGVPYLFFCHEWIEVGDGEIYIAKLSNDLKRIIETPYKLFNASNAKWCHAIKKDCYVTDGPFVLKKDGIYHLIWSSFSLINNKETYCLSHITSNNLFGPYNQETFPVLSFDCGHGMFYEENNKSYIICHSPNSPSNKEKLTIFEFDITNNKVIKQL